METLNLGFRRFGSWDSLVGLGYGQDDRPGEARNHDACCGSLPLALL